MRIEVAKTDLHNALSVVGLTVESGNDLSGHYLFRIKADHVEVLGYGLRTFGRSIVTPAEFEGEEGDAFTVEASRLGRWLNGANGDKSLVLKSNDEGEVEASDARTKIRFRSLDPSKFPYWDELLARGEVVGEVAPATFARVLACSRWFVSSDDTSKPELCQLEAIDGVMWATDRRSLSSVTMPYLPELSLRIPGKDVPSVLRFLTDKRTQEEDVVELIQAERPFEEGGGACSAFRRKSDGTYFGVTRPTSAVPELNVDREAEDQATLTLNFDEFTSAVDVLLAAAPVNHPSVTFRHVPDGDGAKVELLMPCEAGGEDTYPLQGATVTGEWDTDFVIDYGYLKGIADTFNLDEISLGINKRNRGGFVTFRREDEDEAGQGNSYFMVIVWKL